MPVTGQDAIGVERAFYQRIALVRTAVVAGEDLALVEEQGDVLALELYRDGSRRLQAIELGGAGPLGGCDGCVVGHAGPIGIRCGASSGSSWRVIRR